MGLLRPKTIQNQLIGLLIENFYTAQFTITAPYNDGVFPMSKDPFSLYSVYSKLQNVNKVLLDFR